VKSVAFRREREDTWTALERLVERIEASGLHSLSPEDVARLPTLYRATLSSLSVSRGISLDANLSDYLEALAARAYVATYGAKRHPLAVAWSFVSRGFPAAVRAARRQVGLAALVLAAGTATGLLLTQQDAARFYSLVSEDYASGRGPGSTTEELRAVLYHRRPAADLLAAFAMFLFTHNARIGMLCFASGFAAGVPTLLALFGNGLILGAFAGLYQDRGLGLEFWAWLLPHGVTELLAVVLCGAAGLMLADALLFPGRQTRLHALAARGREAAVIVIGAVLMFLAAGLVEGIFRQAVHDVAARLALALVTAAAWPVYFLRAGREDA
jgi:uncharacterized membrane protein SpoIIM required for sporulation